MVGNSFHACFFNYQLEIISNENQLACLMHRSQGSICEYWTSLFCKIGNDIEGGEALCPSLELSLVYVDGCRKWDYASFSASKVCFKSQPRRFDIRIMRFKAGHGGYYLVNVLIHPRNLNIQHSDLLWKISQDYLTQKTIVATDSGVFYS